MSAVSEFLNNFNTEEYLKEEEKKKIINEEAKVKETGAADALTNLEVVEDVAASSIVGAAKGVTYVVDLPFYLVNALESGKDFVFDKAAEKMGFSNDEATEMKTDVEIGLEKADKFLPGEYIRENFLTYDSKSKLGDYAMTIGEYAAPGGLLGKTAKAKSLFTATGAAGGVVDQATTNITGNQNVGTGVGVASNILLDLYALKRGNLAVLSKDLLPSKSVLEKAKKIQSDAKKIDKDFNLSASEATGGALKSAETNVQSTIVGNKIMDKFWTERPDKLKTFIEKWGKENGIVIQNRRFVSDKEYYNQLKKAAISLSSQRSTAWVRAGGGNLKDFFYDAQTVDNLVIQWKNLAKGLDASDSKTILQFAKKLKNSNANGQSMHQVYREIRDLFYKTTGQGVKASDVLAVKKYKSMADSLNTLMSTNSDYVKAQKAYIKYSDEYAKPITKGSVTEIFKSLEKARNADDVNKIGTMWKFLETKAAPSDITALAKSLNKSNVNGAFENIVTGYINNAFIKSQSKHIDKGLSQGVIFHDAIMKDPKQKANLTQMLFELAKSKDSGVKLVDVKNAVNSFANILKSTAQSGKVGSPTASNLLFKEQASKNKVDFIARGIPIKDGFVNWYNDRTFTKNSEIIAKALTSDKGIQAFIDLTQDWKDYNAAISLLRAVTVGAGQVE
tara:strand:+ start:4339 stop:6360 length:2022 start_codon:yes stop_codon:yes gene_type:complete